jgi:hypothetical protein
MAGSRYHDANWNLLLGEPTCGPVVRVSNSCMEFLVLISSLLSRSCYYRRIHYQIELQESSSWLRLIPVK